MTLEDVKQEKCLDYATTLLGLDEKAIDEDFKSVDLDEDGKLTLEEGLRTLGGNGWYNEGSECPQYDLPESRGP